MGTVCNLFQGRGHHQSSGPCWRVGSCSCQATCSEVKFHLQISWPLILCMLFHSFHLCTLSTDIGTLRNSRNWFAPQLWLGKCAWQLSERALKCQLNLWVIRCFLRMLNRHDIRCAVNARWNGLIFWSHVRTHVCISLQSYGHSSKCECARRCQASALSQHDVIHFARLDFWDAFTVLLSSLHV